MKKGRVVNANDLFLSDKKNQKKFQGRNCADHRRGPAGPGFEIIAQVCGNGLTH